ncbi:hypothetical protein Tco_1397150 [Tanacetum coccineum]
MRLLGRLIWMGQTLSPRLLRTLLRLRHLSHPLTVAPPTSLPKSTPPTLVPILHRTARMVVRVPHAMSPGLSASMAEVADMSESTLCKRFRSSYESSPSSSPPDLPSRKHYRGTSELVEDDEEEDCWELEPSTT